MECRIEQLSDREMAWLERAADIDAQQGVGLLSSPGVTTPFREALWAQRDAAIDTIALVLDLQISDCARAAAEAGQATADVRTNLVVRRAAREVQRTHDRFERYRDAYDILLRSKLPPDRTVRFDRAVPPLPNWATDALAAAPDIERR